MVVEEHAADVLAVAHGLVAHVDVLDRVRLRDQLVELQLALLVEAQEAGDVPAGLADPKIDPTSCFSIIASSKRFIVTSVSVIGATAVCTTRPPFCVIAIAGAMYVPLATPMVRMTFSAICPQVSSPTSAVASSKSLAECVAPNTWACSRLNSTGSTATTWRAPAIAAPCTAFMPTPPQPTTTTVSPGCTSAPRLAALGTSCPDHFLRTKVKPLLLDLPPSASVEDCAARLRTLHEEYRADYAGYYNRHADPASPPMRGADPLIVLVPGVGMFSYGKDKQTARVAGEFYVNAINVMRGAEGLSAYQPIDESEKFRIEYWALEEAKLRRMPKPRPLATRIALVTGAASGIGKAIAERLAAEGACVVVADLDQAKAEAAATAIGGPDVAIGVAADVSNASAVQHAVNEAVLAFGGLDLVVNNAGLSLSKSLLETTEADWDLQHDVMAKGSFLVSQAAARVLIDQGIGGDIVYICSKNAIFAGPNNIAYSAVKADQAHQVRLLAAELGEYGVKVNGVNPDGVVQGSGIFAGGWGAQRAAVYGVKEEELGKFYAQRTLLKREVLPEHVANAVFALCGSDLTHTTGLLVPVDAGVAAGFLR